VPWYWIAAALGKQIASFFESRRAASVLGIGRVDDAPVDKRARRLYLNRDGVIVAEFRVALGFTPIGHKLEEGDGRTLHRDWTLGCIAVQDADVDIICSAVAYGTPITVRR
jgi:hypothetical protein